MISSLERKIFMTIQLVLIFKVMLISACDLCNVQLTCFLIVRIGILYWNI